MMAYPERWFDGVVFVLQKGSLELVAADYAEKLLETSTAVLTSTYECKVIQNEGITREIKRLKPPGKRGPNLTKFYHRACIEAAHAQRFPDRPPLQLEPRPVFEVPTGGPTRQPPGDSAPTTGGARDESSQSSTAGTAVLAAAIHGQLGDANDALREQILTTQRLLADRLRVELADKEALINQLEKLAELGRAHAAVEVPKADVDRDLDAVIEGLGTQNPRASDD